MRKIVFSTLLVVAMLAVNNSALAQPASFTADFLQEDYRDIHDGNGEHLVRTNTVTVVWDSFNNKLTFKNFYWRYECVPNKIFDLVIDGLNNTNITWQSETKGSFSWKVFHLGDNRLSGWTYWGHALVSKMVYTNSTVRSVDPITRKEGKSNYKYDGGGNCSGSIDLDKGEITINTPWGMVIGHGSSWNNPDNTVVVEYFNRSKMTIIKTDLVDIVNDGTVGEEYTVTDDLLGVKAINNVPVEGLGFASGHNQNTFMIDPGKYKLELTLENNIPTSLKVSQAPQSANITSSLIRYDDPITNVYILGEVNDNTWDPTVGQPMEVADDGVHYSAIVNFKDNDSSGKDYFSITTGLANNNDAGGWKYVNENLRYGPSSNDFPISLGSVLFAKDFGKYKYPSEISDGQRDYMGEVLGMPVESYDQSNWVMLTGLSSASSFQGKVIKANTITGVLTDKVNPTIAVTSTPEDDGSRNYTANYYIMPSFNSSYYSSEAANFFVAPKPQEYANITWAVYSGGNFYVMEEGNNRNLTGGIKVNWDYYPEADPVDGYVYEFDAIIRKVETGANTAPRLMDEPDTATPVTDYLSPNHLVYPLRLTEVATAINTVETEGKVVDVKYYNLMGVESRSPFNGVNIVVETLDNGTRITSKKLYK